MLMIPPLMTAPSVYVMLIMTTQSKNLKSIKTFGIRYKRDASRTKELPCSANDNANGTTQNIQTKKYGRISDVGVLDRPILILTAHT